MSGFFALCNRLYHQSLVSNRGNMMTAPDYLGLGS